MQVRCVRYALYVPFSYYIRLMYLTLNIYMGCITDFLRIYMYVKVHPTGLHAVNNVKHIHQM